MRSVAMVGVLSLAGATQEAVEAPDLFRIKVAVLRELEREYKNPGIPPLLEKAEAYQISQFILAAKPRNPQVWTRQLNVVSTWERDWKLLLVDLASEYARLRQESSRVPVPMMQLLLLAHMPCTSPDPKLRLPDSIDLLDSTDYDHMADGAVAGGNGPAQELFGHVYTLHNGDPEARARAAVFLGQMPDFAGNVVPHLLEELRNDNLIVVREIVTALGMIGPEAKDAIPVLEELTAHEDVQISERAMRALAQVKGGGKP